ncbi:hypothetical protein GCM10023317_01690 [Actinopolymorpha pittospori]
MPHSRDPFRGRRAPGILNGMNTDRRRVLLWTWVLLVVLVLAVTSYHTDDITNTAPAMS